MTSNDNIEQLCIKYDDYIDLDTFSGKTKIAEYKKQIIDNIEKNKPISKQLIDLYNKSSLSYLMDKRTNESTYQNKTELLRALSAGKTLRYYKKYGKSDTDFAELMRGLIKILGIE